MDDVFQEFRAEFELEGARKLAARLLRLRLGESKRASSLIGRLHLCTEPALEAIADLLVSTKKKADLLTAIERIIPKKAPPSE